MLKNKFLILVISIVALASCTKTMLVQVKKYNYSNLPQIHSLDLDNIQKFKANLIINEISLTGILVAKKETQEKILISFINEFGIKYFDAVVGNANTEMIYCVKKLDKKIVTNILLHDLSVVFLPSDTKITTNKNVEIGDYTYSYFLQEDGNLHVDEYIKNRKIAEYFVDGNKEISVKHKNPNMSLILKPI